ncbi:hypothetical protein B9Z55_001563 [Caenorhabditis nigoni]|uniref:Major sperm protein n=1 Tax=Caenorhabditis nigoni TaxID=1611254 RepID=A0A2G5VGA4_9PELO|nr:hypothetical protein B9Z55_001563 [Caenorhabditis nigoni]
MQLISLQIFIDLTLNLEMVQEENDTLQDDDPATLAALAAATAGPKKKMTKITNGKNEPAFGLKLTPEHLVFKYISYNPGFASFTITNTKPDRQAFKVKSSDNNMYRAKPSVGFIMPGDQVHIRIIYFNTNQAPPQSNEIKKHVTVYHVSAGNAKTYKEAFAKKVDGVHHYFCNHAADMFGAAADENSQDGEKKDEKK